MLLDWSERVIITPLDRDGYPQPILTRRTRPARGPQRWLETSNDRFLQSDSQTSRTCELHGSMRIVGVGSSRSLRPSQLAPLRASKR